MRVFRGNTVVQRFAYFFVACFSLSLFVVGAWRQAEMVNLDMKLVDQSAYMQYAQDMRTSHFRHIGDRSRMPVYPSLMALFYRPGTTEEAFFELGKMVGIGIAIVVLVAAFFTFLRYVQMFEAFTAIQVAAFTVFAYKSPYFQAEVLFYGVTFLLFVLMVELITRPRVAVAFACGMIGGIAHLTKASVLPGMIVCWFFLFLRFLSGYAAEHLHRKPAVSEAGPRSLPLQAILSLVLCVMVFFLTVFPYIHASKKRFGYYFYNVSTTFYLWCDSREEYIRGPKAHGDRKGWPQMPPDQVPSMHKYWHDHSGRQIAVRFVRGAETMRNRVIRSYGYAAFLLIYLCCDVLLIWQNRAHFNFLFGNPTMSVLPFFIVSYFAVYLAADAWYMVLSPGNRYVLTLFLPVLFIFVRVIAYARKNGLSVSLFGRRIPASAASSLILIALLFYLCFIFPSRISSMWGGS